MAYNNSPDSEFDPEIERILQEHFDEEGPNLRAPGDPWEWLESRLDEPPPAPSLFSRWLSRLSPVREGRLSPAFAVAAVAVVAVAVAAVVWAMSGNGGADSPDGLASVPATEAPANASLPTVVAAATPVIRRVEVTRIVEREVTVEEQGPALTTAPAATAAPAAAMAPPLPTAAPEATEAPAAMMMEEEPTPYPAPATTTAAPAATVASPAAAAPTPQPTAVLQAVSGEGENESVAAMRGPRGPAGTAGTQGKPAIGGSATPPDTTFRDYGRQPFVAASEDNVSTFSLDTDRTSYHLALNWARSGYEVNPDSVRAEEWLNAFDYGYAPPSGSSEFAISSGFFSHPLDDGKLLARIAFQAPELVDDKPLNVTLVLDASGSMADGNRVDIARAAAESIRRSLRAEDRIAVVHFTDDVIDRYTVAHRRPDEPRVRNSINLLQPHGSTNVQAGLNLGVSMADHARDLRPDAYNYVILMSDGVANVDATDPFAILETAYDADAKNPLRLITIGVGINNYNDVLLEQLAQHGNGWYRYLDSTQQAQATFTRDNWLALSIPFADQTRAQVTWNPDVVARWRIIGYENRVTPDHTFTQDRKEFAEIYSGASVTVFYELELVEGRQPGPVFPLDKVELRWVDPASGDSRSWPGQSPYALSGWTSSDITFDGHPLVHLGAIVALSADRYSSLSVNTHDGDYEDAHLELSALLEQLRSLRGDLGMLDAYNDFLFLLEHITGNVGERLPSATRSGYSR